jgi:curli biogenesis system outer membrane secretion channel CsgG
MKKSLVVILSVLILGMGSAFAQTPVATKIATPVAGAKKAVKKAKTKVKKATAKDKATPTPKM